MIDSLLRTVFATQWHVIFIVSALLLAVTELGFVTGRRIARLKDDGRKAQTGGVQGAILALMGLLLGFTFAMSAARYEARRELVLREATAINNAYLRAAFLAPERRGKVETLLRDYLDVRLEFAAAGTDPAALAVVRHHADSLKNELWGHVVAASTENPNAFVSTFVAAANELINVDAIERTALRANIPGVVWMLVLFVASCGCYISGFGAGTTGLRGSLPNFVLPLLIAVVITLISDLHRPRGGMIQISQQPLTELKEELQSRQK